MWLPIGVAVIVVLILSTVALIDRRTSHATGPPDR
jgi:hypothetical protein